MGKSREGKTRRSARVARDTSCSVFWQRIQEGSEFYQRLAGIVINEAHLVWGWRDSGKSIA